MPARVGLTEGAPRMAEMGRVLGGRYQLLELVGQGGMATIYRARDDQLGREVAVKVLRAEYGSDTAFVLRFRREAQAAAQLSHPNVVGGVRHGQDEVGPYIVMELVTGGDLAGVLRERGPLPGPRRRASRSRSRMRSRRPTRGASSTGTSSPRTCCSAPAAASRSPTSASPRRSPRSS